jgi:hypothetical protein
LRGPFNVSAGAIAAGVAAMEDQTFVDKALDHNGTWLLLACEQKSQSSESRSRPASAISCCSTFSKGKTAPDADAFLQERGIIARRMEAYGLPGCAPPHGGRRRGQPRRCCGAQGFHVVSVAVEKVAILGLGLIGSSISHAIRAYGGAKTISGHAKSAETLRVAAELGLADSLHASAADAVKGADLIILCAPVGACGALAAAIKDAVEPGAIITDVGSVKGAIVRDVGPHVPSHAHFIPGHPIAGTEQSGSALGFA